MKPQLVFLLVLGLSTLVCTQGTQKLSSLTRPEQHLVVSTIDPQSPAEPKDVATADALVSAMYDVVSGPAAKARNWQRLYSLFFPGAILIRTARGKSGDLNATVLTPSEYVSRAGKFFETHAFYERETSRKTHNWENVEQVFSMYESSEDAAYAKPFASGVNSIELFNDGKRWWITSIMWQEEASQTAPSSQ